MTRREKAVRIGQILDELYPDPDIPLHHHDPFTLLIAVVLSAQTTDARVNLVTPQLFHRARTPEAMVRLGVEEIHRLIRTCGLAPAKAKNIHALSQILVEQYGGQVPGTLSELEALPGVGHKTASVMMVQVFDTPAFPVDTHIHRLAARWGLSSGKNVEQTERDLKRVFPREQWSRLHLQIIYFGREHCPALGHDLDRCRICSWAASQQRKQFERRKRPARVRASGGAAVGKPARQLRLR
ncbi:MAG TPA: endonuclease III [Terriglobales bacterium]|nr:endonuclease III [Terriglobales bacterium]